MAETLFEKVWNRHVVASTDEATLLYIDRHLVHEVTSPQAFDGLRLAGRRVRRPDLTFATRRPQRADRQSARHPRPAVATAGRDDAGQLPRVRHHALRHPERPPGDRPRDRSGAGADASRHDDRLRRQPHQHPRRLRRAGLRDRHQRGRARAGHADALAGARPPLAGDRGDRPAALPGSSPRTSSWRSSARSARAAAPGMSSSTTARRSRPCRWKGG